jgi:DNA uptake protein ComE-like DNA-binding protein
MIGKRVGNKGIGAAALMATVVWLAACSPAATTTTQQPTTAATTAVTAEATTEATFTGASSTETTPESATSETGTTAVVKLNLNTATSEEFLTVPDVGDRMVHEFEEYRPYVSIQQFRQEIGKYVDEEQVAAYEEYVFVPVVPNTSDAETLQQLPGVTPEIAEELIAARPYDSNAAFLEALAGHVTPEQLAIGETYLESE